MSKENLVFESNEAGNEQKNNKSRRIRKKSIGTVILVIVSVLLALGLGGWYLRGGSFSFHGGSNRDVVYHTGAYESDGRIRTPSADESVVWDRFVRDLESVSFEYSNCPDEMTQMIYDGIPDSSRRAVWSKLFDNLPVNHSSLSEMEVTYSVSEIENQIDLDLNRTLVQHSSFRGTPTDSPIKQSLRRILLSYSEFDLRVGYCQSMASPVAFLLTYFDATKAQEYFFAFMMSHELRNFYVPRFVGLYQLYDKQNELMETHLPELDNHLRTLFIQTNDYTMGMYMTWFLEGDLNLAARIWDLFSIYKFDHRELFPRVVVALLKVHKAEFLGKDHDETFMILRNLLKNTNPDQFIEAIKTIN